MSDYCIVITTFGNVELANNTIDAVINARLAACVQTMPIKSRYFWDNKICDDSEIIALFKTRWSLYEELENKIKETHPYDTPEVIAIDIEKGSQAYLQWVKEETKH